MPEQRSGPTNGQPGASPALDRFDLYLQRVLVGAFVGGAIIYFITWQFNPHYRSSSLALTIIINLLSLLFGIAIPFLPWQRFGRNLFTVILLICAGLIAWLIYVTNGSHSPFTPAYLMITISAGLYHHRRTIPLIAATCIGLGFLPFLYETPNSNYLVRQLVLSICIVTSLIFHRLMVPELLERERQAQQLRNDLHETRRRHDDLAKTNLQLIQQIRIDPLTRLFNHGAIIAQADTILQEALVREETAAILFFDIDHFKQINDTFGHLVGDQVLVAIAERAVASLRETDIIGRYGGEEFLAILPATNEAEALAIAERLRLAVSATPFCIDDELLLNMTISIGIATTNTISNNRTTLLHHADIALYQAKDRGRDCVCLAAVA